MATTTAAELTGIEDLDPGRLDPDALLEEAGEGVLGRAAPERIRWTSPYPCHDPASHHERGAA
jgi:hypothetical protein